MLGRSMRELYFAAEMRARSTREADFAGKFKDALGDSFILCSGDTRTLQPDLGKNKTPRPSVGVIFFLSPAVRVCPPGAERHKDARTLYARVLFCSQNASTLHARNRFRWEM